MYLAEDTNNLEQEPIRSGFGRGLKNAGEADERVVALCADLTDSTKMSDFAAAFPERYIEIGVAEQNLVTVASGLAAMGKIPFAASYAAFNPGRNWEQIRTTIALNDQPVNVVGSHAGLSVGPDGATHQMLEDIAIMRAMPNMVVVAPADSIEAEKATMALARDPRPSYMRLAREATPVFTTQKTPFELGKAYVLREGEDITLFGTGTMTYQCLLAADILEKNNFSAEVVHVPTIKPLDTATVLKSVHKTSLVITAEEGQRKGGLGGAIAEFLSETYPVHVHRIGVNDEFGQSGTPEELFKHYKLTAKDIAKKAEEAIHEYSRKRRL